MSGREDSFAAAAAVLRERIEDHDEVRSSKSYQDAMKQLRRLIRDFAGALRLVWLYRIRDPRADNYLLHRSIDDLLESVVPLPALIEEGSINPARRELRYLLESSVKYVYVDQQFDAAADLEQRIRYLGDTSKVPRSSIDPIDDLTIHMLADNKALVNAVRSSFAALSGYIHPAQRALEERLRRGQRGESIGFEGPRVLEAFNSLVSQTLDLAMVLVFEGIGPAFTGDIFIQVLDEEENWKFHRTKYCQLLSAHFDYKQRRGPVDEH